MTEPRFKLRPADWLRRFARALGLIVALAGAAALMDRVLAIPSFGIFDLGSASRAGCFFLGGVALGGSRRDASWRGAGGIVRLASSLMILIGLASILQHAGGSGAESSRRSEPQVDLGVALAGVALLLLNAKRSMSWCWAQLLAGMAGLLALFELSSPVVLAVGRWEPGGLGSASLASGWALAALSLGIGCFRTDQGIPPIVSSARLGSRVARRLLPIAVLVPLGAGWLLAASTGPGILDPRVASPLFVVLNVVVAAGLVLELASLLNRLEGALGEEQRKYATILARIRDGVITTDEVGNVAFMNPEAERLAGVECVAARGRAVEEVVRVVDDSRGVPVESPLRAVLRTGAAVGPVGHTVLEVADGARIPIGSDAAPLVDHEGQVKGAVLVLRDITAERRAQETLEYLAALVESSEDAIITRALDGTITSWNRGAEAAFGFRAEEVVGGPIGVITPPDRVSESHTLLARLRDGEPIDHHETKRRAKDGQIMDVLLSISLIRDARGTLIGTSEIARDVTAQKRADRAIIESARRMRSIVDHIVDGIITIDERGRIESFNPAAERIFGHRADEVIGQNVRILMPEPEHSRHDHHLSRYLDTGEARIIGIGREMVGLRKDGTTFPMDLAVSEFRIDGGRHFTGIVRDISERKQAVREQREAAARLAELSRRLLHAQEEERRRLARELHDEVGQCLTGAKLSLDRATKTADPETVRRLTGCAELVVRSLDHVRDLSRLLRPSLLDDLGLAIALQALVEGLARDAGLEAEVAVEEGLGRVDSQVETACYRIAQEALTNIVRHARARRIRVALRETRGELELSVEDDGVGFDVDVATAAASGGSSLGILGLRERAALAGGRARIESRPGGGTRVRVSFPETGRVRHAAAKVEHW